MNRGNGVQPQAHFSTACSRPHGFLPRLVQEPQHPMTPHNRAGHLGSCQGLFRSLNTHCHGTTHGSHVGASAASARTGSAKP